jgi:hypothetical protein
MMILPVAQPDKRHDRVTTDAQSWLMVDQVRRRPLPMVRLLGGRRLIPVSLTCR